MALMLKWQALFLVSLLVTCAWADHDRPGSGSGPRAFLRPLTCAGIQRAIDRLPASGGEIELGAKTYTCTTPIIMDRDNVCLRGQGPATVLQLADAANAPALILGQTLPIPSATRRNLCVTDLVIDGNRLTQPDECWGGPCTDNPIRNNGITLRRVEDVQIERVTVLSARSGGLVSELGSQRLTVRDFTAVDNHFDGLAAYETENSIFSGLYLYNNCAAGLSFDIRFNNNIISDVIIWRDTTITCDPLPAGTVGIFMRDSRDNIFSSMQILDSREHGIFLAQVEGDSTTAASGNTFSDFVVSGSGGAGLRVNDASCVNNLVCAAQFIGNSGGCISEVVPGLVQVCAANGLICR